MVDFLCWTLLISIVLKSVNVIFVTAVLRVLVAPSNSNVDVTPSQLRPFPTAQRSSSAKKKTAVKAQVITASPYKNQLLAQQAVRQSNPKPKKRCAKSLQLSPPAKKRKSQTPKESESDRLDNTPCLFCEIAYCDSNVQWFLCKNCNFWVCAACAGSTVKTKKGNRSKAFVCGNCK